MVFAPAVGTLVLFIPFLHFLIKREWVTQISCNHSIKVSATHQKNRSHRPLTEYTQSADRLNIDKLGTSLSAPPTEDTKRRKNISLMLLLAVSLFRSNLNASSKLLADKTA
jgi:hypothetical protein